MHLRISSPKPCFQGQVSIGGRWMNSEKGEIKGGGGAVRWHAWAWLHPHHTQLLLHIFLPDWDTRPCLLPIKSPFLVSLHQALLSGHLCLGRNPLSRWVQIWNTLLWFQPTLLPPSLLLRQLPIPSQKKPLSPLLPPPALDKESALFRPSSFYAPPPPTPSPPLPLSHIGDFLQDQSIVETQIRADQVHGPAQVWSWMKLPESLMSVEEKKNVNMTKPTFRGPPCPVF